MLLTDDNKGKKSLRKLLLTGRNFRHKIRLPDFMLNLAL